MSIRHTIVDFLGNVLGEDGTPAESKVFEAEQRCRWMEVAHAVIESYAISAIQMSDVRIWHSADEPESMDHAAWLWNVSPNPNQSRAEFIAELLHRGLNDEDGALVVPVTRGHVTSLYVADHFTVDEQPGREDRYHDISIRGHTDVARRSYRASEAYRFRLMPVPGWSRLLAHVTEVYQMLGEVASSAYVDSGAVRYKLRTPIPISGGQQQMDRVASYIDESLKPFITGERGILPVYQNFDIERLANASATASWRRSEDVIAIRKDMFDVAATCMRVPVSLLYGNTNNFDSVWTSFVTFFIDPLARVMGDEIARKELDERSWCAGGRALVDTTHIKHVDLFDVADRVEKLVGSSIDTPNEIRIMTRQRPVDADGMDDYQRTKNFETAGGGEQNA